MIFSMGQGRTGEGKGLLPEPYSKEYAYQWLDRCPSDSIVHLVICLNYLTEGKEPPENHVIMLSPAIRKMIAEKWYEKQIERQLKIYFPEAFKEQKLSKDRVSESDEKIISEVKDSEKHGEEPEGRKQSASSAEEKITAQKKVESTGKAETSKHLNETEASEEISGIKRPSRISVFPKEKGARSVKDEKKPTAKDPFAEKRTFLEWIEFLASRHPARKPKTPEKSHSDAKQEDQIQQIKQLLKELSPRHRGNQSSSKETIVSERLAQLYEQQQKWEEALEIYKALILHKPHKKDYFEKKIEEIKRKIGE